MFHSNAVSVESAAAVGPFCTHSAPVRCLPERKIVTCDVFDIVYVAIVRYPINTVHRLSLRLDEEQLPSFTQRLTP